MESVTVAPSSLLFNTSTGATVYLPSSPISVCSSRVVEVNHEPFRSAVTGSTSSSENNSHVVTIQISQDINNKTNKPFFEPNCKQIKDKVTVVSLNKCEKSSNYHQSVHNIINETTQDMVHKSNNDLEVSKPTYLYYMMPSGHCSPSDTMDSGTCSDLENTPPPLPKKISSKTNKHQQNNSHNRCESLTDSEASESSLSCDSLNSSDIIGMGNNPPSPPLPPPPPPLGMLPNLFDRIDSQKQGCLPDSLLRDIRDRSTKLFSSDLTKSEVSVNNGFNNKVKIKCVSTTISVKPEIFSHKDYEKKKNYENDKFYKFHINERVLEEIDDCPPLIKEDESFAGYKDIHSGTSTIRSAKGTVRGVKNRVRNGIATFLQLQQTNVKNYKEKDAGKVVLYTTSMGIVRETYAKCANVKQILRTLLIKFEERDVFMSIDYQQEVRDRMQSNDLEIPQLFVDGQHIGDADHVERLNESGELRQMLKSYKSLTSTYTCQTCGGYRLLPCPSCKGSKKSVHRNHFTTEIVALKCMNCDEVGLVKCYSC